MKERNEKQEKEKIPKRGENPKGNKEIWESREREDEELRQSYDR